MSVSKFGSSLKSLSSGVDKNYIDNKLRTLSAAKLNKSGDEISGNFNILLNEDNLRTFGVTDIKNNKSVSLYLGDADNQIRHNCGYAWKTIAAYGVKFACAAGDICRLGTLSDSRVTFFKDIIMRNNYITDLHDPVGEKDAATKLYVDSRCVKNSVGYVPNLTSNANKTGFTVSASSELTKSEAFSVFNAAGTDWLSAENTSFWIEIKCPEQVRIHKIALRGVRTGTIRNWILQASNDDDIWENLYDNYMDSNSTENACIDQNPLLIEIDSIHKYSAYRIWVNNTDGERPGLSYWQIYTADPMF
jgi:hypothetical protein